MSIIKFYDRKKELKIIKKLKIKTWGLLSLGEEELEKQV